MLRPLPDLDDTAAMTTLGRLHALRNAWLDALHALRDAVVRMQSGNADEAEELAAAKLAIARLEEIKGIEGHVLKK